MIRTALLLLLVAVCASAQDGWVSLFNGKDLTGWKVNENQQTFTVKDGAIVSHGPRSHCFYVGDVGNHDFKNFELKVDVMTLPGSNGGVYFHTAYQDKGWPEKGFEVQVNNTHTDHIKSGSLYHVKDIGAGDIKGIVEDNKWFTEHIVVRGDTVTISLNDHKVVEWTQPTGWNGTSDFVGRRIDRGTIALQGHDPGSTVYYKNIRIKPLP
ncbi:MAG: DUF1080 domain-containing protein [Acidobacteria bacterium]|nr:DUF1080 domain-containing protein [Acidobacteriota bacterium]